MTEKRDTETSRRGFLGGAVSGAVGLFVGKARGAVSDGLPKIEMGDAGSDPSSDGVIARNGSDVKVHSGGSVINLSAMTTGGALSDSGTDTDGGDDYQLPNPADNIDMRGDGSLQNVESIEADLAAINNVQFQATPDSNTSIPDSTVTTIPLDTVETQSELATLNAGNNEITMDVAGTYLIIATLDFDSNAGWSDGDRLQPSYAINGSGTFADKLKIGTNPQTEVLFDMVELSVGDNIQLQTFQNSGASQTVRNETTDLELGRLG